MRQHGNAPVDLWGVINALAKAHRPDHREQWRYWRLRFWGAFRELRRAGLLFRHAGQIAMNEFAFKPKLEPPKHLPPSVGKSICKKAGSNTDVADAETALNIAQTPENKEVAEVQIILAGAHKTKSVPAPSVMEISTAARVLRQQPRTMKRPWTGFLNGERVKRGTLVQVPTGEVLPAYAVLRGKVLVALPDEPRYAGRIFDRYDAKQVRRVKMWQAQLLGSLKAGVKEVLSPRKIEAARANGRRPARVGSRPRGRPCHPHK